MFSHLYALLHIECNVQNQWTTVPAKIYFWSHATNLTIAEGLPGRCTMVPWSLQNFTISTWFSINKFHVSLTVLYLLFVNVLLLVRYPLFHQIVGEGYGYSQYNIFCFFSPINPWEAITVQLQVVYMPQIHNLCGIDRNWVFHTGTDGDSKAFCEKSVEEHIIFK